MLLLNFIRALLVFFGIGLFHIYQKDFLSVQDGAVIFLIVFFGLVAKDIIEDYVVRQFNSEDRKDSVFRG